MERLSAIARATGRLNVSGAPEGYDAYVAAESALRSKGLVLFVAPDDARASIALEAARFFAPELEVLYFPAWDCLPYDRVSPRSDIESRRLATLAALAARNATSHACLVVTTVNACLQRVPPRDFIARASFSAKTGANVDRDALTAFLAGNAYSRTGTVREPGEYALRGGIVDLWPPGSEEPLRLDFFGPELESIRRFDAESQLSTGTEERITLLPASETPLDPDAISRFRSGYVAAFGGVTDDDPLYEAVSAGRKHAGQEHWLPLFYDHLDTLFTYAGHAPAFLSPHIDEAKKARLELIADYYATREALRTGKGPVGAISAPYKPLKPNALYLRDAEWDKALAARPVRSLSPFTAPDSTTATDAGGRPGRDFAPERAQEGRGEKPAGRVNIFEAAAAHIVGVQKSGKRVVIACWSEGSAERMGGVLADHGLEAVKRVADWREALKLHKSAVGLAVFGIEHGFEAPDFAVVTEQDILGDRMVRSRSRARRSQNFLAEASSLAPGDLVTHIEHGVGRYVGLKTIEVAAAPHDCLELQYDGGKLFLPVENIELLTRYGSEETGVQLDRLGGVGWQHRKAKMRARVREIAAELIRIAAARSLKEMPASEAPSGLYDEFCARFPYAETEDQERAIAEVIGDLANGRPMDRLVCGDVGFGKTEVAPRVAFVMAMSGAQVAVVVPTTLLARQHYRTFTERFGGLPVKIAQLSRFTPAKDAKEIKAQLAAGGVDIVIGTHAILAKTVSFRNLGLLIVDEEQHFGVAHKERLKSLKADVHVLTLTATPIPRTLQLALSGVRDLSLITTPPIDRLAVRTYVTPFDPLTIREALLREHYRGGQSFYVVPRIADLGQASEFLKEAVPEVKTAIAHGQIGTAQLEDTMTSFYDGKIDVLVSTNIVESGLDIPTANTLIVHRADMFGLAQLYQLRGRIGRAKQRAYAYLTVPADKKPTEAAERRLQVLQSLDNLGAGFSVASHDLDIRGAGNLLGEEQSGHVREVGIELYQDMLEEAVASLRAGRVNEEIADTWSPQISLGAAVLIPESYVPDLNARMALYRRLSEIEEEGEIESFAAELIDRFGPLPDEVKHLLKIVEIKHLCRMAQVEKIEAGPKGATLTFRNKAYPNARGLVRLITEHSGTMRVRPDQTLVVMRDWPTPAARLKGAELLLQQLALLAEAA
ncbi:MAG TPA: transcription-repair coupling factor [Micropepsaceae bacterium]|nr:transcription-repair coupling factor [Micropepsaceae bacterium]